jgi:hypothetical protein
LQAEDNPIALIFPSMATVHRDSPSEAYFELLENIVPTVGNTADIRPEEPV